MSTKIYEGRRLAEAVTIWEIITLLREVMDPVRDRLDATELVHRAIGYHDGVSLGRFPADTDVDFTEAPLVHAFLAYEQEQQKLDPRRIGQDPHRFEASFGLDAVTGRVLMLPFFDDPAYRAVLDDLPQLQEYGYWNNTDRPEEVTDQEWTNRKQAWGRVLPGAPIDTMVSFRLRGSAIGVDIAMLAYDSGSPAVADALAAMVEGSHSPRERAARLVRDLAFKPVWQRQETIHGVDGAKDRAFETLQHANSIGQALADRFVAVLPAVGVDALYTKPTPGSVPDDLTAAVEARVAELDLTE